MSNSEVATLFITTSALILGLIASALALIKDFKKWGYLVIILTLLSSAIFVFIVATSHCPLFKKCDSRVKPLPVVPTVQSGWEP